VGGYLIRNVFAWGFALSFAVAGAAFGDGAATEPGRVSFPTYGISFVPPAGWSSDPCPAVPNIATLGQFDKDHHIMAEITIQVNETPPFERHKLDEFALAQRGEVLVETFSIDQAPTTVVRKTQKDDKGGAFLLLVANHDTRSYSFSGGAPGDNAPTHELIALVKSVKWIPVEDPLDHLKPTQTMHLFDDAATVELPTVFRRVAGIKQKNLVVYMATDAAGKQMAGISFFLMPADANHPGIPDDSQVLEVRRNMLETAQKRWGLNDFPLMDIKNPIAHGVATIPTVVTSLSPDAHMLTTTSRYCAIFGKQGVTYVEFQSYGDSGERSDKWDTALLGIANSLKFSGEAATQPGG
jgi:hypothetical protein